MMLKKVKHIECSIWVSPKTKKGLHKVYIEYTDGSFAESDLYDNEQDCLHTAILFSKMSPKPEELAGYEIFLKNRNVTHNITLVKTKKEL
jgi:hypothetical protein